MQEEVENKAVALAINTTKLTARTLKNAISKYLLSRRQKSRDSPQGKQTVKQLVGQGQGTSTIEITDSNIKSFERVARKYGVDFALKKDHSGTLPRYLVFFKAYDADALTAAFKEYTAKSIKREKKPSILAQLRKLSELVKPSPKREKKKELER